MRRHHIALDEDTLQLHNEDTLQPHDEDTLQLHNEDTLQQQVGQIQDTPQLHVIHKANIM